MSRFFSSEVPPTTNASTTTPPPLVQEVANMEQELASTLNVILASGDNNAIQNFLKLIDKKEMLLEFLLEESPNIDIEGGNS